MDSMQLYREMVIGTAAPTKEELAAAPAHLFGAFSVTDPMSSARYASITSQIIAGIQARNRLPVLVGGTGLYLRFLFQSPRNLPETPPWLRDRLNLRVKKHGINRLFNILKRVDPRAAAHLNPGDSQRVQRFLEVRLMTGQSLLDHWDLQSQQTSSQPFVIGLQMDRVLLWQRLEKRLQVMMDAGFLAEVERLSAAGLRDQVQKTGPIGYRLLFEVAANKCDLDQAMTSIFVHTRRYAKRQMTWFRKMHDIQWFPYQVSSGYNIELMLSQIRQYMNKS